MSSTPSRRSDGHAARPVSQKRRNKQGGPVADPSKLDVVRLEDRVTPTGTVTGTVFQDFNANGVLDTTSTLTNDGFGSVPVATDVGVGGVVVTAFDAANTAQGNATAAANGTYTLTMTGTGPYRLEYTALPAGYSYGPQGTGAGTAVQFVPDGTSSNVNLSVVRRQDVTLEANPDLWTSRYTFGDMTGTLADGAVSGATTPAEPVLVRFPYSAGTTQNNNNTNALPPNPSLTLRADQVGTTWGLGYVARTNAVLVASYTKRHAGFGPLGIGGIYAVNNATGAVSTFWDAADATVGGGAGTLAAARAAYTTNDDYLRDGDNLGWDSVGKTGWGGLAVNDAGTHAYVMNLFDRRLYVIPILANGTADTANINSVAVPIPANATGTGGDDVRPFAVEFYNGRVYVGMVNTAESTQTRSDLRAYVYEFTPAGNGGTFGSRSIVNESAVIDGVRLDYARGSSFGGVDDFLPWSTTYNRVPFFQVDASKYPQPMLTGLAFDAAGNLTLALRDRNGDQVGRFTPSNPSNLTLDVEGISAGDILRATFSGGVYTLESNGNGTAGAGNGQGAGGGEFYFNDNYANPTNQAVNGGGHNEVTVGGIVAIPGFQDVLSTVYDPVQTGVNNNFRSGGVRWFNQNDGAITKAYYLYTRDQGGTFGKAAGLGDLIAVRRTVGPEVGNRVWNDANGNGRQDPGEAGIQNVQVVLCLAGNPIATATTDAAGGYYFSSNVPTGQTTGGKVYADLGQAGQYTVCLPVAQAPLTGLTLTTANAAGTNDGNDSDAALNAGNAVANVTLPGEGDDHTYDIGFVSPPTAQLSGFVYEDFGSGTAANDNNGARDTGEAAIPGTTVTLIRVVSGVTTTIGSTTTDGTGFYQFTGLAPGSGYRVVQTQPANFSDGLDTPGSPGGGTAPQDDTIDAITLNPNDNSQNNNFGELLGSLGGVVYEDFGSGTAANDNNGVRDTGEAAIPGVTLTLVRVVSGVTTTIGSTTTDGSGAYQFNRLLLGGGYRVIESHPAAYADGLDTPGTPGGGTAPQNDTIDAITLTAVNRNSPNNNFGELQLGAQLSGFVYVDANNDGIRQGTEAPIPGATVTLIRVVSGVTTTIGSTTTDGTGFYQFTNLTPGAGYRVIETQPPTFLDGLDTPGSPGGGTAPQDDTLTGITLNPGDNSQNNNFGELIPAQLSGIVYEDFGSGTAANNNNGARDTGEAAIPGVIVVLTGTDDRGSVTRTATTDATGAYLFNNLRPGTYTVTETQPATYSDGLDAIGTINGNPSNGTAGNDTFSNITLVSGDNSPNNNFGELLGSLGGVVYEDFGSGTAANDNNGVRDTGEAPIAGTTITLVRVVSGVTTTIGSTTTDAGGAYQFNRLLLGGGYRVIEAQPGTYQDGLDTPGSPGGGTAPQNDTIDAVTLTPAALNSPNNNFGELPLPGSLSGFVYEDFGSGTAANDNNGARDTGEAAIPGVTLTLVRVVSGVTTTLGTTTTDASGAYLFTSLTPGGGYRVIQTQPTTYTDGLDTPGNPGGGTAPQDDTITGITIPVNGSSPNNNFGELLGSLGGVVYEDFGSGTAANDNNGVRDTGEAPIAGTTITLVRVVSGVTTTIGSTTTDAGGAYQFNRLLLGGGYRVIEAQPGTYQDGLDTPGSPGGGTAPQNDTIDAITLTPAALNSPNNNFGELPLPGSLSGFVYVDANRNGVRDPATDPAIPGTTVTLIRVVSGVTTTVGSTTTDTTGFYQFTGLTPGTGYRVLETQPANYADGPVNPGTGGGAATPNQIDGITVPTNGSSVTNNFGELLGTLSGVVYRDFGSGTATNDDNGVVNTGETGIAGTTVTLVRVVSGTTTTIGSATTDANGAYQFTGLFLGGGYRVIETQPAGFADGRETPGTPGGGTSTVNEQIDAITLTQADLDSPNNNFGELPLPGGLNGYVYHDLNGNGTRDPGTDPVIPGTAVTLIRVVSGVTTTIGSTTTDATGFYQFTNLTPGTGYRVVETQPNGFNDGPVNPGSGGGTATTNQIDGITVPTNGTAANNNFGEVLPVAGPGSLSGYVYVDADDDGVRDAGETPIPGTTVTLFRPTDTAGVLQSVTSTVTDANGFYQFTNLTPGTYYVRESQPAGYGDGQDTPGDRGGQRIANDQLGVIPVAAGQDSPNNNFGELPCFTLFGFVWVDQNQNGSFDPGETPIPGATVTISGTTVSGQPLTSQLAGGQALTLTTDASGRWAYVCLPPGTYTVNQTNTPTGYTDFRSQNSAPGLTVGTSTATSFGSINLNRNAPGPLNFGKIVPGAAVSEPGRPNPSTPVTPLPPSKQNFLGSTYIQTVTVPPAPTNPLLTAPTGTVPLNPSFTAAQVAGGSANYVVGSAGAGYSPEVRVFDYATGGEKFRFLAYEANFTGGVATAVGDVTGDGVDDIITAALAGGGPRVRVFDGLTGTPVRDFFAYDASFRGGVWVAAADFDADGYADIVTGAGDGGGAHVKVFSGRTGGVIRELFAFDLSQLAGARVAAGDFNGDGRPDIAAATGAGVAPQVALFDGQSLATLNRFQAYESSFTGGVNLAAADVNGDGRAEVITGAGNGGGARVRAFDSAGVAVLDFFTAESTFSGGVRVAARDINKDGRADIITGGGLGGLSRVQIYSGASLTRLDDFYLFDSGVRTGVYVG